MAMFAASASTATPVRSEMLTPLVFDAT